MFGRTKIEDPLREEEAQRLRDERGERAVQRHRERAHEARYGNRAGEYRISVRTQMIALAVAAVLSRCNAQGAERENPSVEANLTDEILKD